MVSAPGPLVKVLPLVFALPRLLPLRLFASSNANKLTAPGPLVNALMRLLMLSSSVSAIMSGAPLSPLQALAPTLLLLHALLRLLMLRPSVSAVSLAPGPLVPPVPQANAKLTLRLLANGITAHGPLVPPVPLVLAPPRLMPLRPPVLRQKTKLLAHLSTAPGSPPRALAQQELLVHALLRLMPLRPSVSALQLTEPGPLVSPVPLVFAQPRLLPLRPPVLTLLKLGARSLLANPQDLPTRLPPKNALLPTGIRKRCAL